jgi:CO/xanthine dehydrogenase Mo-binding subunit
MTLGSMPTVATPERRVEGQLKVTGTARYTDDLAPPGTLSAGFLGSPYPAARIVSVDVSAARALPGVRAVLTGADIGIARFGRNLCDWPVLATDITRFIGDRVVAVAAESAELVEEALALVDVEYEELPALLDPARATAPDAPILHPNFAQYRSLRGERVPSAHPNIQGHLLFTKGTDDIEAALAAADLVVESRFHTPRQHHGFLEPHAALVWIEADDTVRVVSTNKGPFPLRQQMAAALDLPEERIVVDNAFIGGDFGGKGLSILEFGLYFLARATGRPVKGVMSYADEFAAANTRHEAIIRLRTAVNRDGRFVAHAAELLFDGGAYAAAKPGAELVLHGGTATLSPYAVPDVRIELTIVYTNTVPGGHMRSPGEVQAAFAGESHVDIIARRIGIDPLELRRRNLVRADGTNATGEKFAQPMGEQVLAAAELALRWHEPRSPGRGLGIALRQRAAGIGRADVRLRALPDGTFELVTGSVDQGAGMHTALQRIVATTLGTEESRVAVTRRSTHDAPFDPGAGGSRGIRVLGEAARRAALRLRELLTTTPVRDEPVEVSEGYQAEHGADDFSFVATAVEVDVDPETGRIRVIDAVLAVDVGEIINPVAHRGQLEGGFVFGLGAALTEQLPVAEGQVLVGSFGDYKIPTVADIPPLRIVELRGAAGLGPYGAKAAGEVSNCGVPPAIANAIAAACGARLHSLPLTAEAVLATADRVQIR